MNNTRPSFYLISLAVDGNVNAIEKILTLYDPYISKCCLRPFYDKYGDVCIVVDMELKGRIRLKNPFSIGFRTVCHIRMVDDLHDLVKATMFMVMVSVAGHPWAMAGIVLSTPSGS